MNETGWNGRELAQWFKRLPDKKRKNQINKWVTSVSADSQFLIPSLKSLTVSVGSSERGYSGSKTAEKSLPVCKVELKIQIWANSESVSSQSVSNQQIWSQTKGGWSKLDHFCNGGAGSCMGKKGGSTGSLVNHPALQGWRRWRSGEFISKWQPPVITLDDAATALSIPVSRRRRGGEGRCLC